MRILLLNQCFHPDHVSTAQHLTDLAIALVEAGHDVTVVASSRGYDDPTKRYPARETWKGIAIHRIWTPGLGKKSKWRRFVDFGSFWLSATFILLGLPRFDVTVCLTSPPLISSLGTLVAALKGGRGVPWVMDLNPDEAVAAGWLRQGGFMETILSRLQLWSFPQGGAHHGAGSIHGATTGGEKACPPACCTWIRRGLTKMPSTTIPLSGKPSGPTTVLTGKFVVMYSGNHSPCHPLDTVLEAAERLAHDDRIRFAFIGGGSEFPKVKEFARQRGLANIL